MQHHIQPAKSAGEMVVSENLIFLAGYLLEKKNKERKKKKWSQLEKLTHLSREGFKLFSPLLLIEK